MKRSEAERMRVRKTRRNLAAIQKDRRDEDRRTADELARRRYRSG